MCEYKRETKVSNVILYNLLKDYSVIDIKILLSIINRLLSKYKAILDKNEEIFCEEILEIGISLKFFNKYKGKKRLSVSEIINIIEKIRCFGIKINNSEKFIAINIIERIEYNKKYKSFRIVFNNNVLEYLIEVYKKFTLVDLDIIKDFSSKYEIGLYFLISMFSSTGKVIKKVEDLKIFFNTKCENKIILNNLRNAKYKLNEKLNYKIKFKYLKEGRKIKKLIITFKK